MQKSSGQRNPRSSSAGMIASMSFSIAGTIGFLFLSNPSSGQGAAIKIASRDWGLESEAERCGVIVMIPNRRDQAAADEARSSGEEESVRWIATHRYVADRV